MRSRLNKKMRQPAIWNALRAWLLRFADSLADFRKRKRTLVEKRGLETGDHEKTLATTWAINFEQVERESKSSAELLRLSAFLAPDRIPDELLIKGASELGPVLAAALEGAHDSPLLLDEVLEPLTRYSLIHRDAEARTYDVHRLVQEGVKAGMNWPEQQLWIERAVAAVICAYPGSAFADWPAYEHILPHALVCAEEIVQWQIETAEAARLLDQTGCYLYRTGRYQKAEPLYERALAIREKVMEAEHPTVAQSLCDLAVVYYFLGRYAEAETLYKRALAIFERLLEPQPSDVAISLNNLAALYSAQERYEEAEALCERALALVSGKSCGHRHLRIRFLRLLPPMTGHPLGQMGRNARFFPKLCFR